MQEKLCLFPSPLKLGSEWLSNVPVIRFAPGFYNLSINSNSSEHQSQNLQAPQCVAHGVREVLGRLQVLSECFPVKGGDFFLKAQVAAVSYGLR